MRRRNWYQFFYSRRKWNGNLNDPRVHNNSIHRPVSHDCRFFCLPVSQVLLRLQDRGEELQLSFALSLCGLAPIIHPTILLSFWTQKEDERFRLSPLVSEALLCLSFFPLLSCTEPSSLSSPSLFVSRYPSPHDAEQEKILWWLFHKHADIIFVGFLGFSHLGRVLQMTEQRADSIL